MKRTRKTNTVRASRDGHEFHEAWAARQALQLVLGNNGLVGISVEGFNPIDEKELPATAVEIADLVLYYGDWPSFEKSDSVVVMQLKYSHAFQDVEYRAADAKKTITKFARAYSSHITRYGEKTVKRKLSFEILTNRPIHPALTAAIEKLASSDQPTGASRDQARQLKAASGLSDRELAQFARMLRITGLAGTVRHNKDQLAHVLADWSAAPDALARARLGQMRNLLREKAGLAGEGKQLITRIDVIAALELQGVEDLLPCPTAFPGVGPVVPRQHLLEVANKIPTLNRPLLIHADGGVGKTVFLQSLAGVLADEHEIELFDCFGGGSYRAPEDSRHLPRRGLVHIANRLACRALCDPLLPPNESTEDLIRAFRSRLAQAVTTLRRGSPGKQLVLIIDAIDNAAEYAAGRHEPCFPRLLLESFSFGGPVLGVQLVVSSRTYRRTISKGDIPCEEFELPSFNLTEATRFLQDRVPEVSDTQVHVAYSRSRGNARILEHLAIGERSLLEPPEIDRVLTLDDLLRDRISRALYDARTRGYPESDINAFLAGLSVLPAPVPLKDYADAHGMDVSAVRSFAADLAPLLEQTRHGLMFRDEPTETLVRAAYALDDQTLRRLAQNLLDKQESSVYSAAALPGLLQKMDDGNLLFALAFDERSPTAITSAVGKQKIRYARLRAATHHAARHGNFDRLIHLLIELGTLAASNERGAQYLVDNPDLVIASRDVDATRRLFETRTRWPGMRDARVTIANVLAGDLNDAFRHARNAYAWINHFYRQDEDYQRDHGGPEPTDQAAVPLCLAVEGRERDAGRLLTRWYDWYAFEITERTTSLLRLGRQLGTIAPERVAAFVSAAPRRVGPLVAILVSLEPDDANRLKLIRRIGAASDKSGGIKMPSGFGRESSFHRRLLLTAGIALSINRRADARRILSSAPPAGERLWKLTDRPLNDVACLFVVRVALHCASHRIPVAESMLVPDDLADIAAPIPEDITGSNYREALMAALTEAAKAEQIVPADQRKLGQDFLERAKHFVQHRLDPLITLTQALSTIASSQQETVDDAFLSLVEIWRQSRTRDDSYTDRYIRSFLDNLGRHCLHFALEARRDLSVASIDAFIAEVTSDTATPIPTLIQIVAVLSKRDHLQHLAGRTAQIARAAIEHEQDVTERGAFFAHLARAILPASVDEASTYFRIGLEQMDAIGSGDYLFNTELLNFVSSLRGQELDAPDFHTLSNISELNLSETDKFPWTAFAGALATASGVRSLARLARWADRGKVSLDYTLLPYLWALVKRDKIRPEIALSLLRLSRPVELYECGTKQLAELIVEKNYPSSNRLLTELIVQFLQSHPGVFMPGTLRILHKLAVQELGADSDLSAYLQTVAPHFARLRDEQNNLRQASSLPTEESQPWADREKRAQEACEQIARTADPTSEASVSQAFAALDGLDFIHDIRKLLLERLRARVPYASRPAFIGIVARLQDLNVYQKLQELSACKREWRASSVALDPAFRDIAFRLIRMHAYDLSEYGSLSRSMLTEISDLSGVSEHSLALELITAYTAAEGAVPPSVWLGLATIVSDGARDGEGQAAVRRLLNSNAAQLASTVNDGPWRSDLYPNAGEAEVAAGLVWCALGSPSADQRWRAAHSVRSFARLSQWEVIDALVGRMEKCDAHPYQAPELPFYYLHARLWMLIAMARLALDHPGEVARYAARFKAIALDGEPHVLMRHFAAQALLPCARHSIAGLSKHDMERLRNITKSSYRIQVVNSYARDSFYDGRPASMAGPENEFHLDYDFDKYDVARVSEMFGRSRWEVRDAITTWVRHHDSKVQSMYDDGGRVRPFSYRYHTRAPGYQGYGYQLAWHGLYTVAGEQLSKYPVIQHPYDEDEPWSEWFSRNVLTRQDGLWLADGLEWSPVDAQVNLLEAGSKSSEITGESAKLLGLVKPIHPSPSDIVVAGDWRSNDGVSIHISSALAPRKGAAKLARQLAQEDPFQAWLPHSDDDEERIELEKRHLRPWIVWPSSDGALDVTDTLGVIGTARRLRLSRSVVRAASISSSDPFGMVWTDPNGQPVLRSQAWSESVLPDENERTGGLRLLCTYNLISDILSHYESDLVVLIRLRRYITRGVDRSGEYWHTLAAVRVDHRAQCHLYRGVINKLHEMNT